MQKTIALEFLRKNDGTVDPLEDIAVLRDVDVVIKGELLFRLDRQSADTGAD